MQDNNSQRSMRIVFLDFDDIRNPLLSGGQARATLEVGKRLACKGHEITVISSRFPGYRDRVENGLNYRHIGLGSKNIRLNNVIYILALPSIILKIKADVIIECFTAPISTLFTPLFTKIPVVALSTSFEAERFSRKYHLPFWLIERIGCRLYKYFFPPTISAEEKMKKMNPSIISKIIPEGVGEEFFKIKRKAPKHILFLGRFDIDQKGIDLLLDSYIKIADKIKWPLVIAGSGPDEIKIRSMIKKSNLGNRINMAGPAYGFKKMKLLSESLFVALPSRHEGFSLFALEALAAGVPIAAFDITGLKWSSESAVLKAKPFDTDEYAAILEKIANDRELAAHMSFDAREFAKRFTWETVADSFESFFLNTVLNGKITRLKHGRAGAEQAGNNKIF